jgi:hypothetical protein
MKRADFSAVQDVRWSSGIARSRARVPPSDPAMRVPVFPLSAHGPAVPRLIQEWGGWSQSQCTYVLWLGAHIAMPTVSCC